MWLRDAHALEEQAHGLFKSTAEQIHIDMEFSQHLAIHGEKSTAQAARLETCLQSLGEEKSLLKSLTGQLTAFAQSLGGALASDEPIKAALAISAFTKTEITSYRILITAADAIGERAIADLCKQSLDEEITFADWLDNKVPDVVRRYLSLETTAPTERASLPTG
jgi:ferritin-like metal-binding protein YciE